MNGSFQRPRSLSKKSGRLRKIELSADQIAACFTKADENDGVPSSSKLTRWLDTQFGDRLSVDATSESLIEGVTSWGRVRISIEQVKGLARNDSEGLPLHRLDLMDGTRVTIILQGAAVSVGSKLLGPLNIPIAAIDRLGIVAPEIDDSEDEPSRPSGSPTPSISVPPRPSSPLQFPSPAGIPEAVKESMRRSLQRAKSDLAKVEKDLAASGNSASLIERQFDLRYIAAQMHARIGEYPEALKLMELATKNGIPASRKTRETAVTQLIDGLKQSVPQEKPKGVASQPPKAPESTPAENTAGKPKSYPVRKLADDNQIVATFEAAELAVLTPNGSVSVATQRIVEMEAISDRQGRVSFSIQLKDNSKVSGHLADQIVSVRFHGEVWNIPARHIESFSFVTRDVD